MLDRPMIRAACACPLCGSPKATGLLACWPCFRYFKLDQFSEEAEYSLDLAEIRLSATEKGEAEHYDMAYEQEGESL